jgi:glycosyltransferase involved in cell wall biosynthesis
VRALVLTADYPSPTWSGIGTAVACQAAGLAEVGVEVHVLAPEGAGAAAGAAGPVVHPLSRARCPVRVREFDVVHLHSLALGELALEMRRRFAVPLVYTAHSLLDRELAGAAGAAAWQRCQAAVMLGCDHVVFLSTDERAAAVERFPSLGARSSVLPNGVPAPALPPTPTVEGGPLVFAGRFARSKGIALLAAVVRRLAPRYQFVLAGGHGDAHEERLVRDLAESCPASCRVVGWVDRETLDALFARAALVLVPSEYEPCGMVALEAMRAGAPVLAAGVGGLVEAVGPGSGGRLVFSRDPTVWCRAAGEILNDADLGRALRRRGPTYVARRHDPVRLARRLRDEIYRPLCEVA